MARRHGDLLTPAFMRPQFITWKATRRLPTGFEAGCVFARASGNSIGRFPGLPELAAAVEQHAEGAPFHLHVYPRDCHEDGVTEVQWADMDGLAKQLKHLLRQGSAGEALVGPPAPEALVYDIIVGETAEEPLFLGWHRHGPSHHAQPGGMPRLVLPLKAPSRAWLKMEQALSWAGLDEPHSLKGLVVLELGCAPGGASYSLLGHGAEVYGVDTAVMDTDVLDYSDPETGASFTHLRMAVGTLAPQHLPPEVDVVVCDINLAPGVIMPYLETICRRHRPAMLILTMKMSDKITESMVGEILGSLRRFVPTPLRATQLPANRREFCVVAGGLGAV
jgi:23S rRNA (cytidine2498-2'-O)-methyltransferase